MSDADTLVVSTVLDHACTRGNMELITMFIYFRNSLMEELMEEITMKSQATKKHKVIERDTGNIAECIGDVRK